MQPRYAGFISLFPILILVKCDRCIKTDRICEQVVGTTRCKVCAKAKQSCNYHISEASQKDKGKQVGRIVDAAEESEEEGDEGEEEEEEEEKKGPSPIAKAFKKLTSPLKAIGKRKTTELSPGSLKDREAESSERARARHPSPSSSVELPEPSRDSSSFISSTMPPPSNLSGSFHTTYDPFYVRRLENRLQESQEDLTTMREGITKLEQRYASRESLLLEEIAHLKTRLGEGEGSRRGGSSGGRGGVGSSSGRF